MPRLRGHAAILHSWVSHQCRVVDEQLIINSAARPLGLRTKLRFSSQPEIYRRNPRQLLRSNEHQFLSPMNKQLLSLITVSLVALSSNSFAATLSVLPGTSIQAKIGQAQPGDIVAIFGGTYNEDININKAIRLVEVSGQEVIISGNVTFSGVIEAPPFEGFTQGSAGRGITVSNTTGLVLRNIDARAGSGINVTGTSNVRIVSCQSSAISTSAAMLELVETSTMGRVTQTAGSMHVFRCTIGENIDTSTGAQKTIAFRTTVNGDNTWRSKKAWFGYCDTRSFNFYDQSNARVVIVGCRINRQNGEANGIYIGGASGSVVIANNIIEGVRWNYDGSKNGVRLERMEGLIANNYISLNFGGREYYSEGDGIRISGTSNVSVLNNLITGAHFGMSAPFGITAKNNLYYLPDRPNHRERDGVVAQNTLYGDPKFITNQTPLLAADSPCLNAGTEDPIYANRDGTRNTIGPSGGTLYDPDARTTENPVVISFDLGPEQVLEGEATEILLSNGQAVSQP